MYRKILAATNGSELSAELRDLIFFSTQDVSS